MNCVDCKASGVKAVATRILNGKGYCSSHARKYFPPGAQLPPEGAQILIPEKKEGTMEGQKFDRAEVAREYQAGTPVQAIADRHGVHHTTIRGALKKMNIYKMGERRLAPKPREEKSIVSAPRPIVRPAPADNNAPAQGRARCRVAMFEVEGDATSVQHAVDAIKAALESRI